MRLQQRQKTAKEKQASGSDTQKEAGVKRGSP
jgi:hypothetical protein